MFVRYDGDPGFSSRNPNYAGAPDAEIEYMLSNGQIDCCPAQWAYPRDQVLKALDSFARTGRVEGIAWSNDSGDGARDPHKRASWDD